MESLEWRAKQLEDRIAGRISGLRTLDNDQRAPICDQLLQVSKLYKNFCDTNGEKYQRFVELYDKHKKLLQDIDQPSAQLSDIAKAELVLAYEDELVRHLDNVKHMAELADKVLDPKKWPDLTHFKQRLDNLQTITRDQHLQSINLDKRTENLIEIYNDIINTFKSNTVIWNQKLEARENEETKIDQDL